MITRWHIKLYWFTIAFLCIILIFLSIPDQISFSSSKEKSHDSKVSNLASKSANATSTKERAQVNRQYNTLMKKDPGSLKKGNEVTLVPVKIALIIAMIVLIYYLIQNILHRQMDLKTSGET